MAGRSVFIGALGSGGDLNPMLAIGAEMRARGDRVTVLAGSWQQAPVESVGLSFAAILDESEFATFSENSAKASQPADRWLAFFYDAVFPAIDRTVAVLMEKCVPEESLLIGASHVVGLRLVSERLGVPLITTCVQPEPDRSGNDEEQEAYFNGLFARRINHHRRRLGLGPLDRGCIEWLASADRRVASLFPEWFITPGLDAPREQHGRTLDFIFYDPASTARSSTRLDAFLAIHDSPVVFTFGTGNAHAGRFLEYAVEATSSLGVPAILLTQATSQVPSDLPDHVLHVDYLPFDLLLPYVALIVHHGGVGTCAQAMRAGIPQLVIPNGFDQFQNGLRVRQLGIGDTLDTSSVSQQSICESLERLLTSDKIAAQVELVRRRFTDAHDIAWCCDRMLELVRKQ